MQKLSFNYKSEQELAEKYFQVVSACNSLEFTRTEVSVLAYIALNGPIKGTKQKKKLCQDLGIKSVGSLNNIIFKMKNNSFLERDNMHYSINSFFKDVVFSEIFLEVKMNTDVKGTE